MQVRAEGRLAGVEQLSKAIVPHARNLSGGEERGGAETETPLWGSRPVHATNQSVVGRRGMSSLASGSKAPKLRG